MANEKIELIGGEHAALLIHGLTGSPFELKYLAQQLHKSGFTVVVPCLDGHATSLEDLKTKKWHDWYQTVKTTFIELKKHHQHVSVAGLCMGTLLALYLAADMREEVTALSLMSTTFFYDGASIPWYRFLLPLVYHTPICHHYSYTERPPYGIKNPRLQKLALRSMKGQVVAYESVPGVSMNELYRLTREVKKQLPSVMTPTLVMHALEDDTASIKNVTYLENHIGSQMVRKLLLEDCYHMLPIDNQREQVAQETICFFQACSTT